VVRRNIQEINFSSQQDPPKKLAVHKHRMPIVKCVCGSEILVLPDLKATNDYSKKTPKLLAEQVMLIASGIKIQV
jgi:hypothetical protein